MKKGISNKRDLLNGVGSVEKVLTGNFEGFDGEKLSQHQENIDSQRGLHYSVNVKIIQEFNKTISIINEN